MRNSLACNRSKFQLAKWHRSDSWLITLMLTLKGGMNTTTSVFHLWMNSIKNASKSKFKISRSGVDKVLQISLECSRLSQINHIIKTWVSEMCARYWMKMKLYQSIQIFLKTWDSYSVIKVLVRSVLILIQMIISGSWTIQESHNAATGMKVEQVATRTIAMTYNTLLWTHTSIYRMVRAKEITSLLLVSSSSRDFSHTRWFSNSLKETLLSLPIAQDIWTKIVHKLKT